MATPEVGSATETCVLLELEALLYRTPENLPVCDCIGRVGQSSIVFIDYSASSAASSQTNLPLSMLTPKNGKLGAWEVCIAWPLLHKGKWKDPQGVEKTFTRFECVLVSLHDPTQY